MPTSARLREGAETLPYRTDSKWVRDLKNHFEKILTNFYAFLR